jgi:hypothetical protein
MKLTPTQMTSIERTMLKVQRMTSAVLPTDSPDAKNVQTLMEIVQELRLCSKLLAEQERKTRIVGADRLVEMFDYNGLMQPWPMSKPIF